MRKLAKKTKLILALLLPIVVIAVWISLKEMQYRQSREFIFSITPYDPFNLFSGHYLTYRVDYGIIDFCKEKELLRTAANRQSMQLCLIPQRFWLDKNSTHRSCELFISGYCIDGRFITGIEKFYVSEDNAKVLSEAIRSKQAKIRIMIAPNGKSQVVDLFVE